jgi:hypothetical protein
VLFIYLNAETVKKIRKPKPWKHSEPITRVQLVQMRDEFWDTAPHYGGRKGCLHAQPVYHFYLKYPKSVTEVQI